MDFCVEPCQNPGLRYCGQLSCRITLANSPGLPERIRNSFHRRVQSCIQTHGQHFERKLESLEIACVPRHQ
ncbi:hypothetical protein C0J52_11559 [Blattella germanica]|nr:hypothetical protein C0J52_11559 [Blattella germanica]